MLLQLSYRGLISRFCRLDELPEPALYVSPALEILSVDLDLTGGSCDSSDSSTQLAKALSQHGCTFSALSNETLPAGPQGYHTF